MEGEQLEDRRNVGVSSCNSGDGTDQRVQSLMFMMMMMMMMMMVMMMNWTAGCGQVSAVWKPLFWCYS